MSNEMKKPDNNFNNLVPMLSKLNIIPNLIMKEMIAEKNRKNQMEIFKMEKEYELINNKAHLQYLAIRDKKEIYIEELRTQLRKIEKEYELINNRMNLQYLAMRDEKEIYIERLNAQLRKMELELESQKIELEKQKLELESKKLEHEFILEMKKLERKDLK